MKINHVKVGVCGLSCRLCPAYHRETESKCEGCKSESRRVVGCPLLNCAVKKKELEFCGLCSEGESCTKWGRHREIGKQHDSFVSYQKLEENINLIQRRGIEVFEEQQIAKENLLKEMLNEFNDGRSKSLYCVAATVLEVEELQEVLREAKAKAEAEKLEIKGKAQAMHSLLERAAAKKGYLLKLRK